MKEAAADREAGVTCGRSSFGATHWSIILAARAEGSPDASAALEQLCATYWYPVYGYLRHRGFEVAEAQDLTQGFFAQLLANKSLAQLEPGRGKFRSFLIAALNHFLANQWRHDRASKRGGGQKLVSLDDTAEMRYAQEPTSALTPETLYDRRFALALFERALSETRQQYIKAGKAQVYDTLKDFLSNEPKAGDYERVGQQLDLNRNAVAAAVYRLRQHYREQVREEVVRTVSSSTEIDEEIRSLVAALTE